GLSALAEKKVTLCHYPPGHPSNFHTISVCESAVTAHLHHGDELGSCPSGCRLNASLCDDGDGCTVDTCDANGVCHHRPVSCDDGNACTVDSCRSGVCVNEPRDCAVGDRCLAGFCNANGDCETAPVSGDPLCNFCGDGLAQPGEQCDGQDLKGQTCVTLFGPDRPANGLRCNANCQFDVSGCAPPDPGEDY
ncbi:MAG TPA: hypothetical protein VMK66_03965, partial [Myxococcales bacterium]|nr:hypothetical protein [Myxococcales bacterium]